MDKKESHYWLTGFAVVMLIYQGWRVFDYMSGSMEGVNDTVKMLIAIAFLSFSEIGLMFWLHKGVPGASTDFQENTAYTLIWIDFAGSMIVGFADLAKHNTMYAIDLRVLDPILFGTPGLMVVANLAGYILYATNSKTSRLARMDRKLEYAEHELEVQARMDAIDTITENRGVLAQKLAPYYVRDTTDRVTGNTARKFLKQSEQNTSNGTAGNTGKSGDAGQPVASNNGNGAYKNLEVPVTPDPTRQQRNGTQ
jgi:hypothetical protein